MSTCNPIQHPLRGSLIITRQVLGRPVCDRGAIPRTLVQSNVVRSRLIILINEEINEANGADKIVAEKKLIKKKEKNCGRKKQTKKNKANRMVSNSAKVDRRTKQHTQFGVSASNGSRDMALTKSWRKKKKNTEVNWMVSNSGTIDRRTKHHTQFGVSASNGSRDMARTKSWRKKRKKRKKK